MSSSLLALTCRKHFVSALVSRVEPNAQWSCSSGAPSSRGDFGNDRSVLFAWCVRYIPWTSWIVVAQKARLKAGRWKVNCKCVVQSQASSPTLTPKHSTFAPTIPRSEAFEQLMDFKIVSLKLRSTSLSRRRIGDRKLAGTKGAV